MWIWNNILITKLSELNDEDTKHNNLPSDHR